jgi:hypothetical protein
MRNKMVAGIVAITLLLAATSKVDAKIRKNAGTISGKQYVVLGGGARAIPDNEVFYIPCNRVNCNRIDREIRENFINTASTYKKFETERESLQKQLFRCTDLLSNPQGQNLYSSCSQEVTSKMDKLNANRPMFQGLYLRETLINLSKEANTARTNFDGNYSLNCPASKCLVFSNGKAGKVTGYWLQIVDVNSRFDLTNSTLLFDN